MQLAQITLFLYFYEPILHTDTYFSFGRAQKHVFEQTALPLSKPISLQAEIYACKNGFQLTHSKNGGLVISLLRTPAEVTLTFQKPVWFSKCDFFKNFIRK